MLKALRNWGNTWPAKILFGLIILSLGAFFGLQKAFFNKSSLDVVARVGDSQVTTLMLRKRIFDYTNRVKEALGRSLTMEEVRKAGIGYRVLQNLINEALLDEEVKRLGIVVSDKMLKDSLLKEKAFQGSVGGFSRVRFEHFLRARGLTEAAFLEEQRKVHKRRQVLGTLAGLVKVPHSLVSLLADASVQKRSGRMLALKPGMVNKGAPSEDELRAFFEKHTARFQKPESRTFSFSIVSSDMLGANGLTPEASKKKVYDVVQSIEDHIAGGFSVGRIAEEVKLPLVSGSFSGQGKASVFKGVKGKVPEAYLPQLNKVIFQADHAETGPSLERLFPGVYVLFEIEKVKPAYTPTFQEIRDEVRRSWQVVDEKAKLRAHGLKLLQKVRAEKKNMPGEEKIPPILLNQKKSGVPPEVQTALFEMMVGESRLVEGVRGDLYLLVLDKIWPNKSNELVAQLKPKVEGVLVEDFLSAYVGVLKAHHHIQIFQSALAYALS